MRSIASGNDDYQVYPAAANLRFYGINAYNKSNITAAISVHNGVSNAGPVLATLTLPPKTSDTVWLDGGGVMATDGLYVTRDAVVEIAVYFNA